LVEDVAFAVGGTFCIGFDFGEFACERTSFKLNGLLIDPSAESQVP
jgi:hypothetical protein